MSNFVMLCYHPFKKYLLNVKQKTKIKTFWIFICCLQGIVTDFLTFLPFFVKVPVKCCHRVCRAKPNLSID